MGDVVRDVVRVSHHALNSHAEEGGRGKAEENESGEIEEEEE